jgi:hypothetical protein
MTASMPDQPHYAQPTHAPLSPVREDLAVHHVQHAQPAKLTLGDVQLVLISRLRRPASSKRVIQAAAFDLMAPPFGVSQGREPPPRYYSTTDGFAFAPGSRRRSPKGASVPPETPVTSECHPAGNGHDIVEHPGVGQAAIAAR